MADKFVSYNDRKDLISLEKLNSSLGVLPAYCAEYFSRKEICISTKEAYARDLIVFFDFIEKNYEGLLNDGVSSLENITSSIIDSFCIYLGEYEHNGKTFKNSREGIKRKVCMLRAFYSFYLENGLIAKTPFLYDKTEKRKRKAKVDCEKSKTFINESIDKVCSGERLSGRQVEYSNKTHKRDIAIIRLLCDTGISLSDCVGLNCEDIDLEEQVVHIYNKKGHHIAQISNETKEAVIKYLLERVGKVNKSRDGNALFLSMQDKRMSGRAIEIMIKKYGDSNNKPMDFRHARRIINEV